MHQPTYPNALRQDKKTTTSQARSLVLECKRFSLGQQVSDYRPSQHLAKDKRCEAQRSRRCPSNRANPVHVFSRLLLQIVKIVKILLLSSLLLQIANYKK